MDIGMLWFDNDPKISLAEKIQRAVDYYCKKYGQTPDLCYVHPSMLNGNIKRVGKVEIRSNRSVLPGHFWIGLERVKDPKMMLEITPVLKGSL